MIRQEEFRIKGPDILTNYLLNPVALAQFFQEAFAYQCADLTLAAYDLQKQDMSWIMTDFKIDFHHPLPRWRENVTIEIWTSDIKGLRLFQDFYAYHQDQVIAKGTSGWLIINEKTRRPCPIDTVSDKFQVVDQKALPDFKFRKIKSPTNENSLTPPLHYKVLLSDVDFNLHLNSIRYISLALENIPATFSMNHQLTSLQIKYGKEAYRDDQLHIVSQQEELSFTHQLFRSDEELCKVQSVWEVKTH